MSQSVLVGKGKQELRLLARMANRHGLVAGATGTGKTVTLRVMAEGLSALGVPVFLSDVKGDLAGMAQAGTARPQVCRAGPRVGHHRLCRRRIAGRLLGRARRARHSDPRDHFRHGAPAVGPAVEFERNAKRRAEHRLQGGRRAGTAAVGSQGSASHAAARWPECQGVFDGLWQCFARQHRRHPARPAGAVGTGSRKILRRAGLVDRRSAAGRCQRAGER